MPVFSTLSVFFAMLILELLYFSLANRFNIIDKPNSRSSHQEITIRGGGIIFLFGSLIFFLGYGFQFPYFISGLILIALVSFADDILTLSSKLRIIIHFVAVALMVLELDLFSVSWYILLPTVIFIIGTINAYNFMDGINGITGLYSLITICTLYFINKYVCKFTSDQFLILIAISLLVFGFFNFRIKARCFAGDVGSVGIAFIILFFLLQLIIKTENLNYLLLLLLYGLDTATTIVFRLYRREKIFDAHRSHFYQYLANEKKIPHLTVSAGYAFIQLVINLIVIRYLPDSIVALLITLTTTAVIFLAIRFYAEGRSKLLGH